MPAGARFALCVGRLVGVPRFALWTRQSSPRCSTRVQPAASPALSISDLCSHCCRCPRRRSFYLFLPVRAVFFGMVLDFGGAARGLRSGAVADDFRESSPLFTRTMSFELDAYQLHTWDLFISGKNIGLFGRACCGKSAVLTRAIAHARLEFGRDRVGVMAWRTHAASLIGGTTFHKFLSIRIAELPKEVILENLPGNAFARAKPTKVKVIFLDEVPKVSTRWLAVFENVMRQIASPERKALPWGGIQVVSMWERASALSVYE